MNILNTLAVTSSAWKTTSSSDDLLESMLYSSSASAAQGFMIWTIVSLVLAIIGGLLIYFLFVKKKANPVNKFLVWLKSYLKFDKIIVEDILKITYLMLAIFVTLYSFGMIGYSFLAFLCTLVFGNILLRVGYELTMIVIMIWSNTTKIKNAMTSEDKASDKKPAIKEAKESKSSK